MKRFLIELSAQIAALVILLVAIGATALIFGGAVGGTAVGLAPEYHFRLLGGLGLLCPKGDTVTFHKGGQITTTDSNGNTTTGTAIEISCDSPDGTSRMLTSDESIGGILGVVGLVLAGYFLLCFVPLFVPAEIVAIIVVHKIVASVLKPSAPGRLSY